MRFTEIEKDVLDMVARGNKALKSFLDDRISGNMNMWNKMPKLKFLSWKDGCKTVKLKASSEVMNLKATNSLFFACCSSQNHPGISTSRTLLANMSSLTSVQHS